LPPVAANDTEGHCSPLPLGNYGPLAIHPAFFYAVQRSSIMKPLKAVLFATLHLAVCACSTESWKRTGYETLQNIHQQQCEKTFSMECGERKSYDAYRREVEELETK
jgi:hypothetical protein